MECRVKNKGGFMGYDFEMLEKSVREKVSAKRYTHTLGVAYTAVSLAMRFGADLEDARAAGLLHDYAKNYSDEELIKKCKKHHLKITDTEKKSPYLLHGKLAACYAEKKFGITKEEVLKAIAYHTTGRADMGLLEKIIFAADFIEPNRKMLTNLPMIRRACFDDIDDGVYFILRDTLEYLGKNQHREIDVHTRRAYEFYKELRERKNNII